MQQSGRPSDIYSLEIQNEASTLHENNFQRICLAEVNVCSSTAFYDEVTVEQPELNDRAANVTVTTFEQTFQIKLPKSIPVSAHMATNETENILSMAERSTDKSKRHYRYKKTMKLETQI